MKNAITDIKQAISNKSIWVALGYNDVKNRYNRSKLGVLWASMSLLIFVSALGPVYARLIGVELSEYMLHFLLGFMIWTYVSTIIMECGREYINSVNHLISFRLSYFTLLFRVVWRNLVVLAYQMLVLALFVVFLKIPLSITWLAAPIGLLIITLNALWMGVLMSIFATRYRDFSELMNNVFRLVFFITPIIWMPHLNADLARISDMNPFFHLIEVFRDPLMSNDLGGRSWNISLVMLAFGWLIAFPVFVRFRSRVAFWL